MSREVTTAIIEAAEEGVVTWEAIARECMSYMSEADVDDMNNTAEFVAGPDEDEGDA